MRDTPDKMSDLPMADVCGMGYGKKAAPEADMRRGYSIVNRASDDLFRFGMVEGPMGAVDDDSDGFRPGVVGRPEGWER